MLKILFQHEFSVAFPLPCTLLYSSHEVSLSSMTLVVMVVTNMELRQWRRDTRIYALLTVDRGSASLLRQLGQLSSCACRSYMTVGHLCHQFRYSYFRGNQYVRAIFIYVQICHSWCEFDAKSTSKSSRVQNYKAFSIRAQKLREVSLLCASTSERRIIHRRCIFFHKHLCCASEERGIIFGYKSRPGYFLHALDTMDYRQKVSYKFIFLIFLPAIVDV